MKKRASSPAGSRSWLQLGALGLVAAAGLGVAWLLWANEAADPTFGRPAYAQESANVRDVAGSALHGDAPVDATTSERLAAATAPVQALEPVGGTPPAVVPLGGILVRVVMADTGAPVAGAEVAAGVDIDWLPSTEQVEMSLRGGDQFEQLAKFGQSTVSDDQGRAGLRGCRGSMEILCRKDDLYGELRFGFDELLPDGAVVEMRRDEQVTVRVVDTARQPLAGVPLTIVREHRRPGAIRPDDSQRPAGETGADGRLVVRHLQIDRLVDRADAMSVCINGHGLTSISAPIVPSAGDIELVVPGSGSIRVRVVGPDGRPLPDDPTCQVALSCDNGDENAQAEGEAEWSAYLERRAVLRGGVAVFPACGLAREFSVSANSGQANASTSLDGPRRDGEVVDVVVTVVDAAVVTLRGRLVDQAGEPLVETIAQLRETDGRRVFGQVRTDGDGRFVSRLGTEELEAVKLQIQCVTPAGGCLLSKPLSAPVSRNADWGDVVLAPAPIVARGRIVAHCPRPPGLTLLVTCRKEQQRRDVPQFVVGVAADSSFAIYQCGVESGEDLQLWVGASACQPIEPIPFVRGQQDIVVELFAGVVFRVRALVPDEAKRMGDDGDLSFTLIEEKGAQYSPTARFANGDLWLTCNALRPGRYEFTVSGAGMDQLHLEGIELGNGRPLDPRLDPLDLRDVLQVMRIKLMSTAGVPLDVSGSVRFHTAESDGWVGYVYIRHGIAECPVPRKPVDVAVCADGYTPFVQHAVSGSFEAAVRPLRSVHVTVAGLPVDSTALRGYPEVTLTPEWLARYGMADDVYLFVQVGEWDEDKRLATLQIADLPDMLLGFTWEEPGDRRVTLNCLAQPGASALTLTVPPEVAATLRSTNGAK